MIRVLLVVALVACGKSAQKEPPRPVDPTGDALPADHPLDAPKQDFTIIPDGIPDDPGWRTAVTVATNAWTQSFNQLGTTAVKVFPLKSPAGEIAPYLVRAEASKGSEVQFTGTALISNGLMINGGGKPRLEAHLASIGFPKTKLPIGHLVEMVHVTAAVKGWTNPPSKVGWEYFDKPIFGTQLPATLVDDDKGAVLTLYRNSTERIEIRFDDKALITTTTSRKAGDAWERFTE